MISYPFIIELFANVLKASKGIQGNLVVCPQGGYEVNSDEYRQVIEDTVARRPQKKYPVALLMPPASQADYSGSSGGLEVYDIVMLFLKLSHNDLLQGDQYPRGDWKNRNTNTNTHEIYQDWHDMRRCAIDFLRAMDLLQRKKGLINSSFRLSQEKKGITPVSFIGNDKLSGVKIMFSVSLFLECEMEDFNKEDLDLITIPALDSHPAHKM